MFTPFVWTIIATVALSLFGLIYLLIGWTGKHSGRVLVRGLGFILIPIGLYFTGLMREGYNAVIYVIDWANRTYADNFVIAGLAVGGTGVALWLVGSFIPQVVGDEAKERKAAISAKRDGLPAPVPAAPSAPKQVASQASKPAPVAEAPSAADDEIDEILRRHGIN